MTYAATPAPTTAPATIAAPATTLLQLSLLQPSLLQPSFCNLHSATIVLQTSPATFILTL
jgi:hypothetical protein